MSNRIFSRRYELPTARLASAAAAPLAQPALSAWVGQSLKLVRRALPGKRSAAGPQALSLEN